MYLFNISCFQNNRQFEVGIVANNKEQAVREITKKHGRTLKINSLSTKGEVHTLQDSIIDDILDRRFKDIKQQLSIRDDMITDRDKQILKLNEQLTKLQSKSIPKVENTKKPTKTKNKSKK